MSLTQDHAKDSDLLASFQRLFEKNLAFFQNNHPLLYKFALTHTPTQEQLGITDSGTPTLIEIKSGQQLTADDPENEIAIYLERQIQNPEYMVYGPRIFSRKRVQHNTCLSGLLQELQDTVPDTAGECHISQETLIPLAICFGQGLGHITQQLPETYDIRHLVIYEPNIDHFYASLFVQDYEQLQKPFDGIHRSITFALGDNPDRLCNNVYDHVKQNGYFHLANVLLFEPYSHDKTAAAKKSYQQLAHRMKHGWGYFSDELRSLKQTLRNSQTELQILRTNSKDTPPLAKIPCCVVGNGPSLDDCIEFLKQYQDKVLIISSGTTIHTLLNHGISPDIQVEVERSEGTHLHLENLAKKGQLDGIPLMTLNTILPEARQLFATAYTFFKVGDLGTEVLQEQGLMPAAALQHTHPLVGNGAAAVATFLGCEHIFFLGMDLSVSPDGAAHSSNSIYHDPESVISESRQAYPNTTQASISGSVQTNELYDNSRLCLELLIKDYPQKKFYNAGNGIRISGTIPIADINDISINHEENKNRLLSQSLAHPQRFSLQPNQIEALIQETAENTKTLAKQLRQLLWSSKTPVIDAVMTAFYDQVNVLEYSKTKSIVPFRLLKGSLAYLQTHILYDLLFIEDKLEREKFLKRARKILIRYFDYMESELTQVGTKTDSKKTAA